MLGGRPTGLMLVMNLPSAEAARTLFASEAYRALVPARDRGFTGAPPPELTSSAMTGETYRTLSTTKSAMPSCAAGTSASMQRKA